MLRRHGGALRVRARVRRICVQAGRACGVELESGERIDAGDVVCNADPATVYGSLLDAPWPEVDAAALAQDEIELVLQVNGKLRGKLVVAATADRAAIETAAKASAER